MILRTLLHDVYRRPLNWGFTVVLLGLVEVDDVSAWKKEKVWIHAPVCAVFIYHAETPWAAIKQYTIIHHNFWHCRGVGRKGQCDPPLPFKNPGYTPAFLHGLLTFCRTIFIKTANILVRNDWCCSCTMFLLCSFSFCFLGQHCFTTSSCWLFIGSSRLWICGSSPFTISLVGN